MADFLKSCIWPHYGVASIKGRMDLFPVFNKKWLTVFHGFECSNCACKGGSPEVGGQGRQEPTVTCP